MAVPQHIDDFKMHYRISRDVFHIILESVQDLLIRGGRGPHDTVTPEKQLLVCVSYLATNQSMRETAHFFNLSKSTVHQIIKEVCNILVNLRDRVRKMSVTYCIGKLTLDHIIFAVLYCARKF